MSKTDAKIYHVFALQESTLPKWLYYPRQPMDSRQSLSITNSIFHRTKTKILSLYGNIRDPKLPKQAWERKIELEESVHGILLARILEWVAFPFSRGSSQPRDQIQVSCIAGRFFTSWATREAQEYWSEQPIPSPEDLPDPGIEVGSPALQANSLPTELSGKLFTELKQKKSYSVWKHKRPQIAKAILRKKKWAGKIRHHEFGLSDKATSSKL